MPKKIERFYDLTAWQKGHQLALKIYALTSSFPKAELFGLVSQLRRASSSITANIAEGFARYHYKDKVRFYYQARGSAAEVQNFLLLSMDLRLVSKQDCYETILHAEETIRLINGM